MNRPKPSAPPVAQAERASDAPAAAASAGGRHPLGEAVATLEGDRTCVACGFNLIGQVVRKEPRYGLFIVRCPECGRVAAVEEHPRIARATQRLTALFAAMWVAALTLGALGVGGAMGVATLGAARLAGDSFGAAIFAAYADSPEADARAAAEGRQRPAFWMFDDKWWRAQDRSALFARWGGAREALWRSAPVLGPAGLGAFTIGVVAATLLLHVRRRRLALAPMLPVAAALGIVVLSWTFLRDNVHQTLTSQGVGALYVFWLIAATALAWLYVTMALGALAGRSIARSLVRAMLPPRLRNSLSILWSADGLDPRKASSAQRRASVLR